MTRIAFSHTRQLAISVAIIVVAIVSVLSLHSVGRSSRRLAGEPHMVDARPGAPMLVETSEELYDLWSDSGAHGRIVVHLSRFLHFVSAHPGVIPAGLESFPVSTFDLVTGYEERLDHRSLLWVTLQSGIAREIVHVLPPADYADRRRTVGAGEPGIRVLETAILTHENGARRLLVDRLPEIDEPVLLAIDASYLDEVDTSELLTLLQGSGLRADLVALSLSLDNPDVGEVGRERLRQLAATLEAVEP